MKPILVLVTLLFGSVGLFAKSASPSGEKVLETFFSEFGKGNVAGVLNTFHPQTTITAVRNENRSDNQLYGTYTGISGAEEFLKNMGSQLDTKKFQVDQIVGKKDWVFASGSFLHILKQTGKPFESEWALKAQIKDGKIFTYHFYEDSASFVAASKK
ncbi:nuclear transport factor 2 family protein [Leptospira bandrabouensis]|uniref:Nuclear transport factor 2 family protein n=1 Tax=Leptospira bandrabouensis TaxID=2484903 RepID=A0A6H3P0X8_9LEPT|nr:nuclear transport factor 2 family protein [Leptospira bandrabouensis]MCG6153516.1 nuclear transport factor 2 family protein [Leptospira bandrabouensis]MCW7458388.1 nuclear transport factor 2 family protein [Leptospira bandrabouensis]MCW7478865.1 nuclear transport factor 2 family protein [Leptospira bandrabouensis]MCW7486471.1 nuclear transport factor 2 family protein [Leptospira bandrabouensis]TGN05917.1 nuclear transport factor 2 family protein [Leptospira bandrabouensis]